MLLQRRIRALQGGATFRGVEPQKILVSCPAELCERMPASLRQALEKEHPEHSFMIITDIDAQVAGLGGMKRWCGNRIAQNTSSVEVCLDSVEPSHLVLVESRASGKPAPVWMELVGASRQVV